MRRVILFHLIYKTTNSINQKFYVGKHTTTLLEDGYVGSGKLLSRAIKKYGIENFQREILHVFETEEEMNKKESEIVTEDFCLRKDTYNLCVGGNGGFSYINRKGLNWTPEKNKRISGFKDFTPEQRSLYTKLGGEKLKELGKGIHATDAKGKNNSFYGRKHTKESKEKISKAMKGKTKV